jgi:hypothetical protein
VEGLYKKHRPLIGSRTKLMQHWADRIDHWLDPKKVMPIKGGAGLSTDHQAWLMMPSSIRGKLL